MKSRDRCSRNCANNGNRICCNREERNNCCCNREGRNCCCNNTVYVAGLPGSMGPPGPAGAPGTSFLIGTGEPTCSTPGNTGDTYVDLATGIMYQRVDSEPIPPAPVPTPDPTSADTVYVNPGDDINAKIASLTSGGTLYFNDGVYNITDPININKSLTLTGSSNAKIQQLTPGSSNIMFSITASDVVIKDLYFEQNYPDASALDPTIFSIPNNTTSNIYADGNTFIVRENAFASKASNLQVKNSNFYYGSNSPVNNNYRYFIISNLTGDYILYNNNFQAGSGERNAIFASLTNPFGTDRFTGTIALLENEQVQYAGSPNYSTRFLLDFEAGASPVVDNFKIFVHDNSISSNGNIPIYFGSGTNLDSFQFMSVKGNTSIGNFSSGFKGLIGLDAVNMPGTTSLFANSNTITPTSPVTWNTDFSPLYLAPDEYLVGYRNAGVEPDLLLNPEYCWRNVGYKLDITPI